MLSDSFWKKKFQSFRKSLRTLNPAEAIMKEAEEGNFSLIMMGASSEEEPKPHLGSVAKKMSLYARSSVLIVRKRSQIAKILVPVDGSEKSVKALQLAGAIAKKIGAEMTLLHVQEPNLFQLRPRTSEEFGKTILQSAYSQIEGAKIDQRLEPGDPGKTIVEIADKSNYDLIVMGSHGHGAATRFLLGSTVDHVIHYANRSVLIAK